MQKRKIFFYLYIVFLAAVFLISAFYLKNLTSESFRSSIQLTNDGMLPMNVYRDYEEKIRPGAEQLSGLALSFYTGGKTCRDVIYVTLKDAETKENYGNWTYDFSEQKKNPEVRFLFNHPLSGQEEKTLLLSVHAVNKESTDHASICVSSMQAKQFTELTVEKSVKNNMNLDCRLLSRKAAPVLPILFLAFLLAVFAALPKLVKMQPERILVIWLLSFGVLYFVLIPMLQVPDELGHFYRSYEISQGDFITPKSIDGSGYSMLPANIIPENLKEIPSIRYSTIKNAVTATMKTSEKIRYANPTQALYSPVCYLPQALGCLVGRILTDHPVLIFYLGRFFNFVVCSILVFWAVRIIPAGKRFMLLMICMPMYLQQMVSLSSDAFLNAWAFLLIAQVLAQIQGNAKNTARDRWIFLISSVFVSLCKIVYLPLCFLVWLIPSDRFETRRKAVRYKLTVSLVSAFLNIGWLAVGMRYLIEFRKGVNSVLQLEYIFMHIPEYAAVLGRTFAKKWIDWLGTMVGAKLGVLNVYTCLPLIVCFLLLLIWEAAVMTQNEKLEIQKNTRRIFFLIFVLVFGITLTSLYIQWTAVQNPYIEGFQGRYLIPILPLLAFAVPKRRLKAAGQEELLRWELPVAAATNICALYSVLVYYL